jgi:hypothetical protein
MILIYYYKRIEDGNGKVVIFGKSKAEVLVDK